MGTRPRTVVTGIGLLTPTGLGLEPYWAATLRGQNGLRLRTHDGPAGRISQVVGEIADFDPAAQLPSRLRPQTDVSTRFALVAADWALQDAKIAPGTRADYATGTVTGNACGGFAFTHREFDKLWTAGPAAVSVYESFAWFYAVNTGQISIRNALRGPSSALVTEQAGGLDAIGHARRTLGDDVPAMLAGGVDSALDPWGIVAQQAGGRLSPGTDPARCYLPFSPGATGHAPGEGGAILVLEDAAAAAERDAHQVYGEIAGYAATFDPPPGSPRPPGLTRAARLALADAGIAPGDVDVVFADAAGVPELDRAEAASIIELFGPGAVPVTAPKAGTGRLQAGAGPVDVATALLALRDGLVPPTPGADGAAPPGIDLVRGEARDRPLTHALVLARGRWGFNAAVVVRAAG